MKKLVTTLTSFLTFAALTIVGCGSKEGQEGEACYPNGTCDTSLVCLSSTCVNPNASTQQTTGTTTGSNSPIDLDACFSCGDSACPSERQSCDDQKGCSEILACTLGCGSDASCASKCSFAGLTAQELAAASTTVASYVACSVTSCTNDCSVKVNGGSTTSGTTGGNTGTATLEACVGCGESACPSEYADCKGTSGCLDLLDCSLTCGETDASCAQDCANSFAASDAAAAASRLSSLLSCTVTECSKECTFDPGNTTSTTGNTTGEVEPALKDGQLFNGSGVSIDVPSYGALGNFFVLEDSVEDGELVSDGLDHSELSPHNLESSSAPCVTGTIAVVTSSSGANCEETSSSCDWESFWGGGIGLTMNQPDDVGLAWDAKTAGVTGFAFSTSGQIDNVPMRFMVEDTSGNQFCTSTVPGSMEISFTDLLNNCWDPTTKSLNPATIKQISWQFIPDASYNYSISNFCITSLSVLK